MLLLITMTVTFEKLKVKTDESPDATTMNTAAISSIISLIN